MASNNLSKRYQNLFIEDFFDVVSSPLQFQNIPPCRERVMTAFVKLWRYLCPPSSPNFFTASGGRGGIILFANLGGITCSLLQPFPLLIHIHLNLPDLLLL